MRHGKINLDLSTEEYLTHPQFAAADGAKKDEREIVAGNHLVRDGNADSNWIRNNGHPGGKPFRIAQDVITGKYFVKVADQLHAEEDHPRRAAENEKLRAAKPYHVPGHGYWLPMEEVFPNHPHTELFNAA